jgi:hypothetical protein
MWRGAWSVQAMQWVFLYRSATDGEVSLRCEQQLHTHGCLGVHRGFKCGLERVACRPCSGSSCTAVRPTVKCPFAVNSSCIHTVVEVSTEDSNVTWNVKAMAVGPALPVHGS